MFVSPSGSANIARQLAVSHSRGVHRIPLPQPGVGRGSGDLYRGFELPQQVGRAAALVHQRGEQQQRRRVAQEHLERSDPSTGEARRTVPWRSAWTTIPAAIASSARACAADTVRAAAQISSGRGAR